MNRPHPSLRLALSGVLLIGLLFSTGCASRRQTVLWKKSLDFKQGSIALCTFACTNQVVPSYPPVAFWVKIISAEGSKSQESWYRFPDEAFNAAGKAKPGKGDAKQLVFFQVPEGPNLFHEIFAVSGTFPVSGHCDIPINLGVSVPAKKVIYLGRIEAVCRNRANDTEVRGGSVTPLIDQAATGFYRGTFDVRITDHYAEDVAAFQRQYPVLKNYTIEPALLPPWTRRTEAEADEWVKPTNASQWVAPAAAVK